MSVPTVLLSAVAASGAGTGYDIARVNPFAAGRGSQLSTFTVQITTTGAATAVTVDLEGSIDGSVWHSLASHVMTAGELTAKQAMYHVVNKPVTYIRGNMTAFTQAASETVTVTCIGSE